MNYILILLFSAAAIPLLIFALSYRNGSRALSVGANSPSSDRDYWKEMTKKVMIGFFVGAAGAVLAAIAIALTLPVPAEIGCITLMSAMVFSLAILCRKTAFKPAEATEKLQQRWKIILLIASCGALFLTQLVFQFFNSLA